MHARAQVLRGGEAADEDERLDLVGRDLGELDLDEVEDLLCVRQRKGKLEKRRGGRARCR